MSNVVSLDLRGPALANLEAEQGVLGAVMYDAACMERVGPLKPEDFFEPVHGRIFAVAADLIRAERIADPVLVRDRLSDDEGFKGFGLRFLMDCVDQASVPAVKDHAAAIVNAARLRAIMATMDELRGLTKLSADAFDIAAHADRAFTALLQDTAPDDANLIDAQSSAYASLAKWEEEASVGKARGAMTGLRCFDRRMKGLRPGWLVVVAGRPSMGKTALARAAALGCAMRNRSSSVLFFALEMEREELDERTLSQLSHMGGDGIAYKDMGGELSPSDRMRLRDIAGRIPANLIIDDSPVLTIDYVRRRVLSMKRRGPIAAVFIDYLQIMERPDGRGRNEASVIGEMTKALKQLAREAKTCVVLLSQINRGVENRDDKRPQLSDLRESGAIEQDANAVLFPYREVYYLERAEPKEASKQAAWETEVELKRRCMDVQAAKVRGGAAGTDRQIYFAEFDHIEDAPEERR